MPKYGLKTRNTWRCFHKHETLENIVGMSKINSKPHIDFLWYSRSRFQSKMMIFIPLTIVNASCLLRVARHVIMSCTEMIVDENGISSVIFWIDTNHAYGRVK